MKIQGILTALVTPFTDSGEIDFDSYRRILITQKKAGVFGVIPCGTTGESPTLTVSEKKELIRFTLRELKDGDCKVFAGTGSNSTEETVDLSKWASKEGVDGLLIVTPYYNKPSQAGLKAHFTKIAKAVNIPIMLYNVPGRTGVSFTADTVAELSKIKNITSLKEASGNLPFTSEIIGKLAKENSMLDILSGDDVTFLPHLAIGATGVVSVASNLFPKAMVKLYKERSLVLHNKYYPLFRDLFIESNPVPIKHALKYVGLISNPAPRLPLSELSKGSQITLENALTQCGFKKGGGTA